MNPKSSTLFHFTGNIDILKSILKDGFWPRYCLEDVAWLTVNEYDYISFPMVCFCDIPLSRIEEHVGFYGRFGIGMSRKWAEQNGLNPILYVSGSNHLAVELLHLNEHANELEGEKRSAAKETMRYIFAHIKPTTGSMVIKGAPVQKRFYQESEWRYVPKCDKITSYLKRVEHDDSDRLLSENLKTRNHCLLKFEPSDVRYIFVENDSDVPAIMNHIQSELDGHSLAAIKILSSRVLSLESLHEDL
jgi:hypothetical protein